MKFIYSIIIIFVFSSNVYAKQKYFGAPNQITDWKISCTVDKGSIIDNYPNYFFKTSNNRCSGDKTYKQRAEIVSGKALPLSTKVAYDFQSDFTFEGDTDQKFDIFQMHDGRDSCAPPLKISVLKKGEIRLIGDYRLKYDYKEGDKEQCERDIITHSKELREPYSIVIGFYIIFLHQFHQVFTRIFIVTTNPK